MKRTFLVLCLAFVMMLSLVSFAQAECEEHVAYCGTPTTCLDCGATDVECWIVHINRTYTHDETTHFYTCDDCGFQTEAESHYTDCTAPDQNYCWGCGASGVVCEVGHYWSEVKSDAEGHWSVCSECGEEEEKYYHYANCTAPDTCEYCGYTGSGLDVFHNIDWDTYSYNEKKHWRVCADCGEKQDEFEHYTSCTATDTCLACGATGIVGDWGHNVDWNNPSYDESMHWYECEDCGEQVYKDTHYSTCGTTECVECGVAGDFDKFHRMENLVYEANESTHKEICTVCDEVVNEEEHYTFCTEEDTTVCYWCGYQATGLYVYHFIDDSEMEYDAKKHWSTCLECGETVAYDHYFRADGTCWCGATDVTYYYDNTACSFGPRFRDQENAVTDKWFMYTPVDLSKDGTQTFDLIASNVYKIGTVSVTVAEGKVTVDYRLVSKEIKVSSEFMTIIPALEDVTTVDQEAFTAYAFGEAIDIQAVAGDDATALIYICNVVDYNTGIDGVEVM
ncbi:MAG: hypothetical protein E7329_00855 [Clostridiales bacterium]|nr:hypothetical protein [Clostridiales bacterium]